MSQQFDTLEDERDVPSTDDDVLNLEDIDMEDAPHSPVHLNTYTYTYDTNLGPEGFSDHIKEYETSNSGNGVSDDEILDELEQDVEFYGYWEEKNGILDCQ